MMNYKSIQIKIFKFVITAAYQSPSSPPRPPTKTMQPHVPPLRPAQWTLLTAVLPCMAEHLTEHSR